MQVNRAISLGIAILSVTFGAPAAAVPIDVFRNATYLVDFQVSYAPNRDGGQGGCFNTIHGIFTSDPCVTSYNSETARIPDFELGAVREVGVGVNAVDGPINITRTSDASLGFAVDGDLFKARVSNSGSLSVSDCIGSDCYSAVARAGPTTVAVRITDSILGEIPQEMEGRDVFLNVDVPISALVNGSASGEVFLNLNGSRKTVRISGNGVDPFDPFNEVVTLRTLVRSADSIDPFFSVQFQFNATFISSANLDGGYLDALNSVGFEPDFSDGLVLRSESGLLDSLLIPHAIPEPETWALMAVGLVLLAVQRRRRLSTRTAEVVV